MLWGKQGGRRAQMIKKTLAILVAVGLVGSTMAGIFYLPESTPPEAATPVNDDAALANLESTWLNELPALEAATKQAGAKGQDWMALANKRYDLGELAMERNQPEASSAYYAQAVEAYQQALKQLPDDVNARVDLATAAFYSQQLDVAEKNFKQALAKDPKHVQGQINYGIFLAIARQDVPAAKAVWEQALAVDPSAPQAARFKQMIAWADSMLAKPQGQAGAGTGQPDLSGLRNEPAAK
ncbi:tetratricopeptide repeat protein [Heliophilum fasciatum]|uniref:Tetratricopeptide repeat protein n=1 Tax=Heliophilum fasciatum TaxID=35700 RepID=A0A4R2RNL5_9FIRM|nr:tetratricopeptide repeat protein [Heliophilum fasciatum]MCW2279354.1 tetratricopeptide (TPR) repeat protein [Heliophilum fasciatum]TCP60785.1 tetratricopeptide repeat protein [Heliophilum fasciatum]